MGILRPKAITPKLAEIGRIHKGGPKRERQKGGRTYQIFGEDLNHFRFEPNPRTADMPSPDGNGSLKDYLLRRWAELGAEPRTIAIQFVLSTPEAVFSHGNEVWKESGGKNNCLRRCNGETQSLRLIEKDGKQCLTKEPIPCDAIGDECPHKCQPTARLSFMLPALGYPGLVVMTTHSLWDINEILSNLEMYRAFDLDKMRFQLCRTERNISYTDDSGGLRNVSKWLCHLEIEPTFGNRILSAAPTRYLAQLEGTTVDAELLPPADERISESQRAAMNQLVLQKNIPLEAIKSYLLTRWDCESSADLLAADYDRAMLEINSLGNPQ